MKRTLRISVEVGDALRFKADVLALKFAQSLYGLDREAVRRLTEHGLNIALPTMGDVSVQDTDGCMGARALLFVGVTWLQEFGYREIREFAHRAVTALADAAPHTRHLALTVHGPGYGLDEIEAFESEVAGILDAAGGSAFPPSLETITFIEKSAGRAQRLSAALESLLPQGGIRLDVPEPMAGLTNATQVTLRAAGYASAAKSHVFVAMPFAEEMDDVFHYGIQGAVNAAGLLCERADLSTFTGDVMDWVKRRISSATLVIADLSTANPNVYLEVGYAWGCKVPTVLLARDANDLKFDVKSQRCIVYKSIKSLQEALTKELKGLA